MNSFAWISIPIPEKYRDYFSTYCLTSVAGSTNNPEHSPFPRMVDMWFLALCIAVKDGLTPNFDLSGKTYKAIEGTVLGSDNWRSDALLLLAIGHTGNADVLDKPNEMMKIANAYAMAGLPKLIGILEARGGDCALDHLSEYISKLVEN